MSEERAVARKIEAMTEARRNPVRSPHVDRILHTSNADSDAIAKAYHGEVSVRFAEKGCTCYPRGVVSMSAEDRDELRRLHIEAGHHKEFCRMFVAANAMYTRKGDVIPPSYTLGQEMRDAEWERADG